ncbi:UDP-N-acetylenolpyruvoylglucosamine reductase [Candidatus Campbellbacteria bacterium]|nr:UDP-N-acetylenolpyruvoylglucosamine reductase [Candidatus Campbellbacteria bacterium]|tara:strand:- start:1858 stop:2871 length:1014 start_codon:yes stop_codon:yes gene_type:complete
MKVHKNVQLKDKTSFMVPAVARSYVEVSSISDVQGLIATGLLAESDYFILGGGSNVLFTDEYKGTIIAPNFFGKEIVEKTSEYQIIKVAASESWHEFVGYACDHNLWGIENLVLIPGTVGASAVQNIGAYGVEAKDTISNVEAIHLATGEHRNFSNNECQFTYRNSFFKQHPQWLIISVSFKLLTSPQPVLNYGTVSAELARKDISTPSLKDITSTITEIRRSKLPDVGSIGMAGSFFKNPVISEQLLSDIQKKYPTIPFYEIGDNKVKIPAAWIIETLGYKGIPEGKTVGTYHNHALVIAHDGTATGKEVREFIHKLQKKTKNMFGITLEPEVIIL